MVIGFEKGKPINDDKHKLFNFVLEGITFMVSDLFHQIIII